MKTIKPFSRFLSTSLKYCFLFFLVFSFSCEDLSEQHKEEIILQKENSQTNRLADEPLISEAPEDIKKIIFSYVDGLEKKVGTKGAKTIESISRNYDIRALKTIKYPNSGNKSIYSALFKSSSGKALTFIMHKDDNNKVLGAFKSTVSFDPLSKIVTTKIYDLGDRLKITVTDNHKTNTRSTKTYGSPYNSFWDCFDSCIGNVFGPFGDTCNLCNVAFGMVASASTLGFYAPASVFVCGVFAIACASKSSSGGQSDCPSPPCLVEESSELNSKPELVPQFSLED